VGSDDAFDEFSKAEKDTERYVLELECQDGPI
jgi:hypothetical protein